jgi:NADH dehydrogenase
VRNPAHARKLFSDSAVELFPGDVRNPDSLATAMMGVDAVIHLVGIISERRGATFEDMHIDATRQVIEAMHAAGVARLVHMSALGTRAHARARYHSTKWAAEELVRNSGLEWTIFRPSIVYGPGDHFLNFFAGFARWPVDFLQLYTLPVLGGGKNLFQPIAVQDVAQAFVSSVNDQRTFGQTLDLCGSETVSFRQIMELLAQIQGHHVVWDETCFQVLARHALWAATFYSGVFFLVLLALGKLTGLVACILLSGLVAGTLTAVRWRSLLLFPVPMPLLLALGWTLDRVLPDAVRALTEKWLHAPVPSLSQMQMLEEDNIGNATPAAVLFDFQPRTLEQGLAYLKR